MKEYENKINLKNLKYINFSLSELNPIKWIQIIIYIKSNIGNRMEVFIHLHTLGWRWVGSTNGGDVIGGIYHRYFIYTFGYTCKELHLFAHTMIFHHFYTFLTFCLYTLFWDGLIGVFVSVYDEIRLENSSWRNEMFCAFFWILPHSAHRISWRKI